MFNATPGEQTFRLPADEPAAWRLFVDTAAADSADRTLAAGESLTLAPRSLQILVAA